MLIGIGPKRPSEDVVDALLECHERIRRFSELARRLGEQIEPSESEVKAAAAGIHRYFSEALPLHVRDEEESIAPRLSGLAGEVGRALQRMTREHSEHQGPLGELLALCRTLRERPSEYPEVRERLARVARGLERDFAAHLENEERHVFPAIREKLSPRVRDEIAIEIRARRVDLGRARRSRPLA